MSQNPSLNDDAQVLIEPERYEFFEGPRYEFELARRDFFKVLARLVVCFVVSRADAYQEEPGGRRRRGGGRRSGRGGGRGVPQEVGAWLHINAAGEVTAFSGKVEIGQNARTSLTQAVAEEAGVPVAAIRFVLADTDLTPFDAGTFGSGTTPRMVPQIRRVAASGRTLARPGGQTAVRRPGDAFGERRQSRPRRDQALVTFGELAKEQQSPKPSVTTRRSRRLPNGRRKGLPSRKSKAPRSSRAGIATRRTFVCPECSSEILRAPSLNAKLKSVDLKAAPR